MKKKDSGPPTFAFENEFWRAGHGRVAGIDEAGRGCLAGGVAAAAVILDRYRFPARLDDSKKLSASAREALYEEIMSTAVVSVDVVAHDRIDAVNIRRATFEAMEAAARGLPVAADAYLVDGNALPQGLERPAKAVVSGDALSLSVAAASIVAKVVRDRMMLECAALYPEYGFEIHMGYPTKAHSEAIAKHGPCPIHRMTFGPLKAYGSVAAAAA
jgi:ribonuclease HII